MTNELTFFPEIRQLYYFSVLAEELNLCRAAERLYISQPPLSRQLRQFEEKLGVRLFVRHNKGLTLTPQGQQVLKIAQHLLKQHEIACENLKKLTNSQKNEFCVGFSNAFELGVFTGLQAQLKDKFGSKLRIVGYNSPKLVREVKNNRVDLAFVAMPLETKGLLNITLAYVEKYMAALPQTWPEAELGELGLRDLANKPVFWYRREANPAFYDFTKSIFVHTAFSPIFVEEPDEHESLLARIAAGEAAGIFSSSFSVIKRPGVVYRPLKEGAELCQQMGVIAAQGREELLKLALDLELPKPFNL